MKRPSGIPVVAWNDIERAISALVSEHRAEMERAVSCVAAERDRERAELDRLKGELAEARGLLLEVADCEAIHPDLHRGILAFLAAPPPAESTPVQPTADTALADGERCDRAGCGHASSLHGRRGHGACRHGDTSDLMIALGEADTRCQCKRFIRSAKDRGGERLPDAMEDFYADPANALPAIQLRTEGPTIAELEAILASEGSLRIEMQPNGEIRAAPAPPDDIRERLERLEAKVELNAVLCKAATQCTEVGPANVASNLTSALEAKGEPPTCYDVDCRYYGQRHATPHEPREEAKGELGTMFCDEHGREDCGRPDHPKGAKP